MIRLSAPPVRYDLQDQSEMRRSIEQAIADLAASMPANTGAPAVSGSGTTGKIPIWTTSGALGDSTMTETAGVVNFPNRPTFGGNGLALLSESISQTAADLRYKPIGYFPTWAQVTGTPTTIGGYGITDFNSLGDARWLGITATAAAATKLITPRAIAGVNFDGTAAIAIPFAGLSSIPTTIGGYGITDFNSLGDARWLKLTGGSVSGAVTIGGNLTTNATLLTSQPIAHGAASTTYGYIGIVTAAGAYVNDGALGDMIIRTQAKPMRFSVDSGTSTGMLLDTSANLSVVGTVRSSSPYGLALGDISGVARMRYGGVVAGWMDFLNSANGLAGLIGFGVQFGTGGPHIEGVDPTQLKFFGGSNTTTVMSIYASGVLRGYAMYADSTGFGWLHSGGSWLLKNPYGTLDLQAGGSLTVATAVVVTAGDVSLSGAGKQFKDSFGNGMAPIIVSASAASGTAADKTLFIQV